MRHKFGLTVLLICLSEAAIADPLYLSVDIPDFPAQPYTDTLLRNLQNAGFTDIRPYDKLTASGPSLRFGMSAYFGKNVPYAAVADNVVISYECVVNGRVFSLLHSTFYAPAGVYDEYRLNQNLRDLGYRLTNEASTQSIKTLTQDMKYLESSCSMISNALSSQNSSDASNANNEINKPKKSKK